MRYITDENNYIIFLSFTAEIECESGTCTEYTGEVPAGYDSLEAWYLDNVSGDCFASWKIIDGQLVQVEEPRPVTPDRKPDDPGQHPAAAISYDNATSGLRADNVQNALDEVYAKTVTQVEEVENQVTQMQTQVEQNAEAITQRVTRSEVDNILLDYPTTTQTEALISQSAEGIELSVIQNVSQDIEDTARETARAELTMYVQKNDNDQVVSMLNASADEITITGNRIGIESDNFSLTPEGEITAQAGTIGGFTITDTELYTEDSQDRIGNYVPGIRLDTENGVVSVGAASLHSNTNSIATVGTDNAYILFNEAAQNIGFIGSVGFDHDVTFQGFTTFSETKFWKEPEFVKPLSIPNGGTGATTAKAARQALGIYAGSVNITPSTSNYVDSDNLVLMGAAEFLIIPAPMGNTGVPLNCTAYITGENTFKIRVHKATSWGGDAWTFVWHAIKKS